MKHLTRFLAIATLTAGLTVGHAPKAQAAIGVGLLNPGLGLFMQYSGITMFGLGLWADNTNLMKKGFLVMLLDGQTSDVEFQPIHEKDAFEMGITREECQSYNREIDRLNATFDEMDSDLQNAPKNELEEIENKSIANLEEQLSPATISAAQKIIKYSLK